MHHLRFVRTNSVGFHGPCNNLRDIKLKNLEIIINRDLVDLQYRFVAMNNNVETFWRRPVFYIYYMHNHGCALIYSFI